MSIKKALFAVQGDLVGVKRTKENDFTKAKYADMEEVLGTIRPVLQSNGILLQQFSHGISESKAVSVHTVLTHVESGESETVITTLPCTKEDPQSIGSVNTYACRYALMSYFALPQVDDDGNAASRMSPGDLNTCLESFVDCETMEALRELFTNAKRDASGDVDAVKAIVEAKNKQKSIIECLAAYERHKNAVDTIRDVMAVDDYYAAAEAWHSIPDDDRMALNLAPTKGGILTTKERGQLKSDEFGEALRSFIRQSKVSA